MTRALVAASLLALLATSAVIVQAVALANLIGSLFEDSRAGLWHAVVLLAVASVARGVVVGLGEPVTSRIAGPLRRELRSRALRAVLRDGPTGSFDATVQLCTRGVDAIEAYLVNYVPSLLVATIAPVVLLGWLATHDVLSAVIVLVSVALLPVFMVLLGLEARAKMEQRWREQQRLAGYFGDVVRGMTVLKSFNRSAEAVANVDRVGESLQVATMSTLRVAFLSGFALELLSSLATALVALVLGLRLLNGSIGLNVALAVLLLTPEVFVPLRRSAAQYHASSNGIAAATEVLALVERPVHEGGLSSPSGELALELRGVVASAEGRRISNVAPVDATIPAGSLVVITGASGSGKSTLLRVVAGLRAPSEGRVLVGGVDLASMALAQWHRDVAWMPQDPRMPGGTVREALTLGSRSIDDRSIEEALHDVGLDVGLDRPLGEGAGALSGGERRRLALARCLVRRPRLLLLDEPLAHLDERNASEVAALIEALPMTRLVATHRPMRADQTIEIRALVTP